MTAAAGRRFTAGICSVGSEVTTGDVPDTNAAWLARRLVEAGADVAFHLAVGDVDDRLVAALRWLVGRCDAVVVGGGLGPTPDDRTRAAVAAVAGVPLERRPDLVAAVTDRFAATGAAMPESNLRQAEVPAGAAAFPPVGTAPGFGVEVHAGGRRCAVYALPGVPFELREMATRHVLPDVTRRAGGTARVVRSVHVVGMGESATAAALSDLDVPPGVEVSFLARAEEVEVRLGVRGTSPEAARAVGDDAVEAVVARLGAAVAGVDDEGPAEAVARLLRRRGWTVATAESCTAGLVAARLAAVPGASDYLRGGVVAYATDVKSSVLGIAPVIVEAHGPLGRATVTAMAERARRLFGADLGVSVACVAGPATQAGQPVGTTLWGLAVPDGEVRCRERLLAGDRDTVRRRAAAGALEVLRRYLLGAAEG